MIKEAPGLRQTQMQIQREEKKKKVISAKVSKNSPSHK